MLPDGMKLEKLLEKLFEDDDESMTAEDVVVLERHILPKPFTVSCCTYNYAIYGG